MNYNKKPFTEKTTKKLIAIGYWNSKFYGEERFIYPQELATDTISNDMVKLSKYISEGMPAIAWAGCAGCRICDETLGTCCLTDGVYIWPQKLEHYILKHKIILPEEFINHAKNNKWKVKKTHFKGLYDGRIEEIFWISWCQNNRNLEKEPKFEFEEYNVPKNTGNGKITPLIMHDLFSTIENLDLFVLKMEIDGRDLPKDIYEKYNGKEYCWTAEIKRGFRLLTIVGSENLAASALIFEGNNPIIYCEKRESMYGKFHIQTRYCPDLALRINN